MRRQVVVVGGGITGLTAAYELTKERGGPDVVLLESSGRLGGKIRSEAAGDVVFEGGPDSFVTNKPWALELVRELGLEDELLRTGDKDKSVHIYTRGRLRRYPDGLMLMAPTMMLPFLASDFMPFRSKLRMGLELFLGKGDPAEDESLASFARRRFGEEALQTIVGPIMASIYAGDPERLSLKSTFPQFRDMEAKHGSVMRAMLGAIKPRPRAGGRALTLFVTMKGGLTRIVDSLWERMPSGSVRLRSGLREMAPMEGGRYRLVTDSGDTIRADAVVLALPSGAAGRFMGWDEAVREELSAIEYCSTAVVCLAFRAQDVPGGVKGFGFVTDRREKRQLTAATYSSSKFPGRTPEDKSAIRCYLGGVGREDQVAGSDEDIVRNCRLELREILGLDAEPLVTRVYRWPEANPQYNVGHDCRVARIDERIRRHAGFLLAGASYRGLGLPECVRSGREAAKKILDAPENRPPGAVV